MAARLPYDEAHALLAAAGRENRKGLHTSVMFDALRSIGYRVTKSSEYRPKQKNGSAYTMKTVSQLFKRGYYIVHVTGHFAALVNGEVYDWTRGRRQRVLDVYKIEKVRS